jgi:hypothetical protein
MMLMHKSLPKNVYQMQVWSGGHDSKLCALDAACTVKYQVGALKENGDVSQLGGTKAIVRWGWNVWVFGLKALTIYSAHALAQQVADQVSRLAQPSSLRQILQSASVMHGMLAEYGFVRAK